MSKFQRSAVATVCVAAVAILISFATPATRASSEEGAAKPAKAAKEKCSSQDKAKKTEASKKAEAKKAKAGEKYDDFEDDDNDSPAPPKASNRHSADKSAASTKAVAKPAAKSADDEDADSAKTPDKVVRIVLHGDYPEITNDAGLFSELQPSLRKLLERLDEVKKDKEVAALWLRIEDLQLGRGKVNELRAAIAAVRKAGKPVYAELTSADSGSYLVACSCDFIYMPCSGTLMVPGVRAEMTYYKGLLDKLGLKFESLQMGKYKGAAEPLSRSKMSGPLRESLQAIVDDVYDNMVATISKDRHMADYAVKTAIDQGLFTATMAKDAGLIDEVLYTDQFQDSLAARLKLAKVDIDTTYKKKQLDTDFSGLGGFMKLMETLSGGKKSESKSGKQKIAIVYAVGEIVEGKSTSGMFGGSSLGSATLIESLKKAFDDPKVLAVVLRIDSPGGSATASDLIWRETVRHSQAGVRKPMVASMGNVAGSGGYYIAMGAKKIFAEPETLTGSIGVVGGKLVTGGLYDKLGLNTEIISRGKNSGIMSSNDPFSPEEKRVWMKLMEETYHEFVSKAAEGRKMEFSKLEKLAQGRVYTGRQAKKLGLVDEIGTLKDALAEAKTLAGLKPDADVDILVLPQPKSLLEQLFGEDGPELDEFTGMPGFVKTFAKVSVWKQLLSSKVMLWMPYHLEIK